MKGYVRVRSKRFASLEAQAGASETAQPAGARQLTHLHEFSDRFNRAFESAVQGSAVPAERASLLALAHCSGREVRWVFTCGEQQQALEAWCRSPYCPGCAHRKGSAAARFVRDHWEEDRLLLVAIPLGAAGGLRLPSEEAVAEARTAWARITREVADITGLVRLEPVPRTVLGPDGLSSFLRLPWRTPGKATRETRARLVVAEGSLADAVRAAYARAELPEPEVCFLSREAAALRFRQALAQEAERFYEIVRHDLERHTSLAWRDEFPHDASREAVLRAVARRWLDEVQKRHKTRRRRMILGSRESLSAPDSNAAPDFANRACPVHGRSCRAVSTLVMESSRSGRVLQQVAGSLTGTTSRQEIATFLREAAIAG